LGQLRVNGHPLPIAKKKAVGKQSFHRKPRMYGDSEETKKRNRK
jgi:hypothetical protein